MSILKNQTKIYFYLTFKSNDLPYVYFVLLYISINKQINFVKFYYCRFFVFILIYIYTYWNMPQFGGKAVKDGKLIH